MTGGVGLDTPGLHEAQQRADPAHDGGGQASQDAVHDPAIEPDRDLGEGLDRADDRRLVKLVDAPLVSDQRVEARGLRHELPRGLALLLHVDEVRAAGAERRGEHRADQEAGLTVLGHLHALRRVLEHRLEPVVEAR